MPSFLSLTTGKTSDLLKAKSEYARFQKKNENEDKSCLLMCKPGADFREDKETNRQKKNCFRTCRNMIRQAAVLHDDSS